MGSVAEPLAPASQGNAISRIYLPILKSLKEVIPHDAYPAVGPPELLDHSFGNHDSFVRDVGLSCREHAVDRQEPVGIDVHPVR